MDLAEELYGPRPMSIRRFRSLAKHLPQDGAVGRALNNPVAKDWGNSEELLASLIEVVDHNTRTLLAINLKKADHHKIPKPLKVKRPYAPPVKKRQASSADLKRIFGAVQYVPADTTPREG